MPCGARAPPEFELRTCRISFISRPCCRTIRHSNFMKLFDLSGEVAVVIGASGVLGGAMAEGLAQAGALVAVLGRNAERGEACVNRIKGQGGKASFFSVDAMSRDSLREAHK